MSSLLKINSAIARLDGKKFGFYRALKDIGAATNVQPNDETYSGLLQLCYNERLFNESRALFNEISDPTINHFNHLIRTAIKSKQSPSTISSLMNSMNEHGYSTTKSIVDELILYNTHRKSLEGCLSVLHDNQSIQPSIQSITNIINLAANLASPRLAFDLAYEYESSSPRSMSIDTWLNILRSAAHHHYMPAIEHAWSIVVAENKTAVDEGTCILVLNACARAPNPQLSTLVIAALKNQYISLQEHHLAPVIEAYSKAGNIKEPFIILGIMRQNKITPQLETAQPIVKAITKSVDAIDDAYYLLQDLHKEGEVIDVSAINVIISASAKLGDMHRALSTFQEMGTFKLKPSTETYNILLSGCIDTSNRSLGDKLLTLMKKEEIQPDKRTFERLIVLCLTQSTYEDAFFYLEEMKSAGHIPPQNVYETLIRRCKSLGDSRYKVALEELHECKYKPTKSLLQYIKS
ncbi:hypothetical protein E3P99_00312 [Wallemia hederae]|uniref:Pentatricopeptide repeat-containing protein-mitochondrial domain-containing protein n=1 Tax=Wallemia hederae TaxID=1540922 RepID=A0A4T0FWK4_9BASI|nr:hypothetical protein E3P99_00312 [Wallemia hederae]